MTGSAAIKFQPAFGDGLIAASVVAGSALIGQIAAGNQVVAYNGATAVTPQSAEPSRPAVSGTSARLS